jgi:predicted dithiol-disulfide oxidoreductase (DUF899 family)
MNIARPPIVSAEEWTAAVERMAELEVAVAAQLDELAAARKRMPMTKVENPVPLRRA